MENERERNKREKQERKRLKEEKRRKREEKRRLKEERRRRKGEGLVPEPMMGTGEVEEFALRVPFTTVPAEEPPEYPAGECPPSLGAEPADGAQDRPPEAPDQDREEGKPDDVERPLEIEGGDRQEGWFQRLRKGLSRSRINFFQPLSRALANRRFDEDFWEEVENILIGADVGYEMTLELVDRVRRRMGEERAREPEEVMALFKEEVAKALDVGSNQLNLAGEGPSVIMVVGVNGTGKTTTIAKLGHMLRREGKKVILAAGDTFRAAGIEQLEVWGQRIGVHTVKHRQGADAAAVVHDAVEAARARDMDVVIVDTAGRLHTKANLMEELKKIKRVANRSAPVTETLLVIDATTGQNGLIQAKQFREAVEITGLVLTKLDGTAKGGIVVAIAHELGIPIKFIGMGEDLDDLHPFDPKEFAEALFS
jgi:fused signal recognition particle receptor